MMAEKIHWFREGSKEDGIIFFKKHQTRKHGVKYDRYFRTEYQHQGKRISFNFGWESEGWSISKCQEKLKAYKANAKSGTGPTCPKEEKEIQAKEQAKKQAKEAEEQARFEEQARQDISFGDFFFKSYLPSCLNKKEKTLKIEAMLYNKWINPVLGRLSFSKIKPLNLTKIQRDMTTAGRSPRSVQYVMQITRQAWNVAINNNITPDPFPKITLEKFDNNRIRFLTDDEIERLLSELKKVSEETYNHSVLALNTGMRAGEIWGLTWADVDLENGILTLRDTKNRKTRIAYLNDITLRLLTERKPQNPDPAGLVFSGKGGSRIDKVSRTFKRVADKIGLNAGITDSRQKIVFHSCRHTFASKLVKNHIDIYVVKELLGHSELKQTSRYAHNAPENLRDAVNSLSGGKINMVIESEGGLIPFQKLA